MRFLLLNTDYPAFMDQLYRQEPGLQSASYAEQMRARNATFFGVGDAYARALRQRGHDAHDIHMNNPTLQAAWVREHGPRHLRRRFPSARVRLRRGIVPWVERRPDHGWLVEVLAAQIDHHRPDVVLNHDISWLSPTMLRQIIGPSACLVGQHAAPPYPAADYTPYDLVVSSWPPTIERMRAAGIRTEHLGLGFDPSVLEHIVTSNRDLPITFVGSLSAIHGDRTGLIEAMCTAHPEMRVFAPSIAGLSRSSPIRGCYSGPAFGLAMFEVLARSQVTINHHGFREPHANNMRLFEATGAGALLLTDAKPDLNRYFTPGSEVLTYDGIDQCVSAVSKLADMTRRGVARAGQQRTLRDHTWERRIEQLLSLLG
jgi:hypothetical protein